MTGPEAYCLSASTTLRDGLARIEAGGIQMAIVVDDARRLLGVVTDGDIRRGLLRGLTLDSRLLDCATRTPLVAPAGSSDADLLALMSRAHVHHVPVVDAGGRIVEVKFLDRLLAARVRPNSIVLMVGGMGRRLGELTRAIPKPMLPVGGRPLLEAIVANYRDQGFGHFILAVNHHAEIIQTHFGDGARFGCRIDYVRETKPLGTAGALSLLATPLHPVIVSNGDLLHHLDLGAFLDHHSRSGATATMAVRAYDHQIPYGVVRVEDGAIAGIEEKPVQRVTVSGGLYVLEPAALTLVPRDTFHDMPALFQDIVASGQRASVFPIDGYWLDIGRLSDYEQALRDSADATFPAR